MVLLIQQIVKGKKKSSRQKMFNRRIWQVKTLSQEIVDARLLKQQQWLVPSLFHQYNSSSPSMAAIGKHISWFVDCGHPSKWLYLLTVTDDTCICDFPKPREKKWFSFKSYQLRRKAGARATSWACRFPSGAGRELLHPPTIVLLASSELFPPS